MIDEVPFRHKFLGKTLATLGQQHKKKNTLFKTVTGPVVGLCAAQGRGKHHLFHVQK